MSAAKTVERKPRAVVGVGALEYCLNNLGMSPKALGDEIGIARSSFFKYLKDKQMPKTIEMACKAVIMKNDPGTKGFFILRLPLAHVATVTQIVSTLGGSLQKVEG